MEFGASRIDPIIPKEPRASRQDSSDCLKSACFPFKSAFDDQEEKPGDGKKDKAIGICLLLTSNRNYMFNKNLVNI